MESRKLQVMKKKNQYMKCNSREQEIKKLEINVIILFCYLFPPPLVKLAL